MLNDDDPDVTRPTDLAQEIERRLKQVESLIDTETSSRAEIDARLALLTAEAGHLAALLDHYSVDRSEGPQRPEIRATPDAVVALIRETGSPLHYRDIERILRERGIATGLGKDPANALLATYFKDSRLVRVGRGTYALAGSAPSSKPRTRRKPR